MKLLARFRNHVVKVSPPTDAVGSNTAAPRAASSTGDRTKLTLFLLRACRHRQLSGIGDEILQRASIISSPPRSEPAAPSAPPSPSPSLPPNPQSSRRKSRFHGNTDPDSFSSSLRRTTSSASNSPTSAAQSRLLNHRRHASASSSPAADGFDDGVARLNAFLARQRDAVSSLDSGGRTGSRSTKIVLSDASKSKISLPVFHR